MSLKIILKITFVSHSHHVYFSYIHEIYQYTFGSFLRSPPVFCNVSVSEEIYFLQQGEEEDEDSMKLPKVWHFFLYRIYLMLMNENVQLYNDYTNRTEHIHVT